MEEVDHEQDQAEKEEDDNEIEVGDDDGA